MSENDPYGSEGGARNDRPYPYKHSQNWTGFVLRLGTANDGNHLRQTGVSRTVASDERGYYTLPLLPVGTYQMRSELMGFQAAVQTGITLVVGQETVVNVRMRGRGA